MDEKAMGGVHPCPYIQSIVCRLYFSEVNDTNCNFRLRFSLS